MVRKNRRKSIKKADREKNLDTSITQPPYSRAKFRDESLQDSARDSIRKNLKTRPENTVPHLDLASLKNYEKEFLPGDSQSNAESDLSLIQTRAAVDDTGTTSDAGHTDLVEEVNEAKGISNTVKKLNGSGADMNNEHRRNKPIKSGKISEMDKMTKFGISSDYTAEHNSLQLVKEEVEGKSKNIKGKYQINIFYRFCLTAAYHSKSSQISAY